MYRFVEEKDSLVGIRVGSFPGLFAIVITLGYLHICDSVILLVSQQRIKVKQTAFFFTVKLVETFPVRFDENVVITDVPGPYFHIRSDIIHPCIGIGQCIK